MPSASRIAWAPTATATSVPEAKMVTLAGPLAAFSS
jgi:hypothetical protein